MIVRIFNGSTGVEQVDDLSRLKVVADVADDRELLDRQLAADGLGHLAPARADSPAEALLTITDLRRRALAVTTDPGWPQSWDAMIAAAERAGWITADGEAVRAHVESMRPSH